MLEQCSLKDLKLLNDFLLCNCELIYKFEMARMLQISVHIESGIITSQIKNIARNI